MALKVKSARWELLGDHGEDLGPDATCGYEALVIEFDDGRVAHIDVEQKPLFYGINAVPLNSPDFADEYVITTHPEHGSPLFLERCTDDARVVYLTQQFLIAVQNHTFRPRRVFP